MSEQENEMTMIEKLSEELGEKELKIMEQEKEIKKLKKENKEVKINLMKCEVNWLYYWSGQELGEEAYHHPDWWMTVLEKQDDGEIYWGDEVWKTYYPELYDNCGDNIT